MSGFEAHPDATVRLRPYVAGEGDSDDSFFILPPERLLVKAEPGGIRTFLTLDPIGVDLDADHGPPAAYRFDWDDDETVDDV